MALHVTFAAPANGNEKGGVEGVHGYIEDNFFRQIPSFGDVDELNTATVIFCDASLEVGASAIEAGALMPENTDFNNLELATYDVLFS